MSYHDCEYNCGATDCPAPNRQPMYTYTAVGDECKHKNGWYASVKFWVFTKKIYLCVDCGHCREI